MRAGVAGRATGAGSADVKHKGAKTLPVYLDTWSDAHPVAHSIATGTRWFDAWVMQRTTPLPRLAVITGIPRARLDTIAQGDRVSLAEIDALARAWSISAGDLRASLPVDLVVV